MRYILLIAICLLGFTTNARASVLCFELHDHPDGAEQLPLYGLRLDELFNDDNDLHEIFTFEFDGKSKSNFAGWKQMQLVYDMDADTVRIFGHVYGGLNDNDDDYVNNNARVGTWFVDFTYTVNVVNQETSPDLKLEVTDEDEDNRGTIQLVSGAGSEEIDLTDYQGGHPHSFLFDNDGHRTGDHLTKNAPWLTDTTYGDIGDDLYIGRGWLDYDPVHYQYSDWLFVGVDKNSPFSQIPEPASVVAWLGLGLAGAVGARFRRRRRSA